MLNVAESEMWVTRIRELPEIKRFFFDFWIQVSSIIVDNFKMLLVLNWKLRILNKAGQLAKNAQFFRNIYKVHKNRNFCGLE